ncbi:MAG: vanadium-dependent haloperoxidase [Saprospiraceae bacterium]
MKFKFLPLVLLVGIFVFQSCRNPGNDPTVDNSVKSFDHKVLSDWTELFLRIDKDALAFRPAPGPRALAYLNWATYEACVPGMHEYNSLKNLPKFIPANIPNFDSKKEMYWPEVVNEVQAYLMSRMYEKVQFFTAAKGIHITNVEAQQLILNLKLSNESNYLQKTNATTFNNSKAWGEEVARAVWEWSTTDIYGHEHYLNVLNNDPNKTPYYNWRLNSLDANGKRIPGKWAPTNDNPDGGMTPFGGKMRAFVSSETQEICRPPLPYSENPGSAWYIQNEEAYNRSFTNVSYEDEWIGQFWSDDLFGLTFSPPCRLFACLDQIMDNRNCKLDEAIYATALLGLASNDFAVCCWNSKYYYNVERPEHFIKEIMNHPEFEPPLNHPYTGAVGITPAFPAYPSGHSTFGGGGFFCIAAVFGDHQTFTDNCHKDRTEFNGKARTYYNLSDAGYEDAISRVPLGVHVRQDCEEGVRLGREIAARAVALPWKK